MTVHMDTKGNGVGIAWQRLGVFVFVSISFRYTFAFCSFRFFCTFHDVDDCYDCHGVDTSRLGDSDTIMMV